MAEPVEFQYNRLTRDYLKLETKYDKLYAEYYKLLDAYKGIYKDWSEGDLVDECFDEGYLKQE